MPILVGMMRMMSNHVKLIVSMAIANNWGKNPQRKLKKIWTWLPIVVLIMPTTICCNPFLTINFFAVIGRVSSAKPLFFFFFFFFVPWKKHTMR